MFNCKHLSVNSQEEQLLLTQLCRCCHNTSEVNEEGREGERNLMYIILFQTQILIICSKKIFPNSAKILSIDSVSVFGPVRDIKM